MELFKNDGWLAQNIGKPSFSFNAEAITPKELSSSLKNFKLEFEKDLFLFTKVPTHSTEVVYTLEKNGFNLIDTNVQLILDGTSDSKNYPSSETIVRFASQGDRLGVAKIAESSFVYSRFHLDTQISNDIANEIKRTWADNYFLNKRGDKMIVAEHQGEIAGFIQLLEKEDTFIIDLIAVKSTCHKKGIGLKMILFCLQHYNNQRGLVGTQVSNIPSINLYLKCGFKFSNSSYVFHYHHSTT